MDSDPSGSLYLSVTHLLAETGRFIPFDDLCVKLNSQCNRNQCNTKILKESPQLLFSWLKIYFPIWPQFSIPSLTIEREILKWGS